MSNKKKKRRREQLAPPPATRTRSLRDLAIMGLLALCGVAIGFGWRIMMPPKSPAVATQKNIVEPAEQREDDESPVTVTEVVPLGKLLGRWVRTEGGFVIDVQEVASDGKLTAAYLNPKPIHVAKAEAKQDSEGTRMFIELRDVNYPGSTYHLTYNPRLDRLTGEYFQAVQQQTYRVEFDRAP